MHKTILAATLIIFCSLLSYAQQWNVSSFDFDGETRVYKTYHNSSSQKNMSVVFMFHGLGGSKDDIDLTNWKAIADTANILLVSPEALSYTVPGFGNVGPAWNSGITLTGTVIGDITLNPEVDDIGFIKALIDTLKVNFHIDEEHIFIGGFSNGGFLTQRLLCEIPQHFRAAASNGGTKALTFDTCSKTIIPVAHFHGTEDSVVTWEGIFKAGLITAPAGVSVDSLIDYWVERNNVKDEYDSTIIGNSSSTQYITLYSYNQGNSTNFKEAALYKVHNTGHVWLNFNITNNEFDIAVETWRFYMKHSNFKPNSIHSLSDYSTVRIFPNPTSATLYINSGEHKFERLSIINQLGRTVAQKSFASEVSLNRLATGIYIIQLTDKAGKSYTYKFVKE